MTIGRMNDIEEKTLYCDLLRQFRDNGHSVYTVSPCYDSASYITNENGVHMLKVQTKPIAGVSGLIKKGIATLSIEPAFIKGVKKFLKDVKFDLVMYSTPPITFYKAIKYIKKRDGAKTYLLLKDIFPQNSIDLGMLSKSGIKGLIYKYFRKKEKNLYAISDRIGCMSSANCEYVLKYNPEVDVEKIEVCPNSIEPIDMRIQEEKRNAIRLKYEIPTDKKVFVYGGNLGKPQGVRFIVECLKACRDIDDAYFLVIGAGTDKHFLDSFVREYEPSNVKVLKYLPKNEYDSMIACCDVGLIFLDNRFTIPNFPSRLLAYMQAGLPVLACTDKNTDVGQVITEGGFGWWCESVNAEDFKDAVKSALSADCTELGNNAFEYLCDNFTVEKAYKTIMGE